MASTDTVGGLPPPPGVKPNFVDPPSLAGIAIFTVAICLSISTILVWTRLYTRFYIIKSHGWEDYTCFFAWIGFIAYATLALESLNYGGGTHQWDVPITDLVEYAKLANGLEICYGPVIYLTKLSILIQLLHIFVPLKKGKTYYLIHFIIWFNLLFYIADVLVEIFECTPRAKIWNPSLEGTCVNINIAIITTTVINMVSDFSILLIPITHIWKLQMPMRRKFGISMVFATGLFACVSSTLRLVESIAALKSADATYTLTPVGLWTMGEIASGLLCGCLPVLPQLYRHTAPKLSSTFNTLTRHARGRSTTDKSSEASAFRRHPTSRYRPRDPHFISGSYTELDERSPGQGLSTDVQGRTLTASESHKFSEDIDAEALGGGTRNREVNASRTV